MADYRIFQLRLNRKTDGARIAWLERQANITEEIRTMIDKAMADVGAGTSAPTGTGETCDATAIASIVRATMVSVLDEKLQGAMLAPAPADDLEDELGGKLDNMDF